MKVLMANKYFYLKGGSERVFFNDAALLEEMGDQVIFFSMKDEKNRSSPWSDYFVEAIAYEEKAGLKETISRAARIIYSFEARRKLDRLIDREKPDIAHLHNIHHQLSPSIIHALKKRKIPVVMTLHDYKMVCPVYTMLRRGHPCEECSGGKYYRCLANRCTKGSYSKSLINTIEMYLHHRVMKIYDLVDVFIAPSKFLRDKMISMGLKGKIVHQPYLMDTGGYIPAYGASADSLCYFGRLSPEKGLMTLIKAMEGMRINLRIIGEGPESDSLQAAVADLELKNVQFAGYRSGESLKEEISDSLAVVVPSEWYENYPCSVLEAFALGKPVIGARIGGIPEMVRDGKTGFTFEPKNIDDLRRKIKLLLENRDLVDKMGREARKFVEENLNPSRHYRDLMNIYRIAAAGLPDPKSVK
jgi:glycosyltransferase involved in cell wall biosynthesis